LLNTKYYFLLWESKKVRVPSSFAVTSTLLSCGKIVISFIEDLLTWILLSIIRFMVLYEYKNPWLSIVKTLELLFFVYIILFNG